MTLNGEFLAGVAVVDDVIPRRGWMVAYPAEILENPFQMRPILKLVADLQRLGPYDELRAWVVASAEREERFARWMGFRLDCGPASGFSACGRDMNLYLWRRST